MKVSNQFQVGANSSGEIIVMNRIQGSMSREEALSLAAWLVVLADPTAELFPSYLKSIEEN